MGKTSTLWLKLWSSVKRYYYKYLLKLEWSQGFQDLKSYFITLMWFNVFGPFYVILFCDATGCCYFNDLLFVHLKVVLCYLVKKNLLPLKQTNSMGQSYYAYLGCNGVIQWKNWCILYCANFLQLKGVFGLAYYRAFYLLNPK